MCDRGHQISIGNKVNVINQRHTLVLLFSKQKRFPMRQIIRFKQYLDKITHKGLDYKLKEGRALLL
jgi:hypothetical protein